jgi:hypothetical protein
MADYSKVLIKVDRNGTKYWDVTDVCPRCGGRGDYILGGLNYGVCFDCGGNGKKQYTVKEYTPEHEAKLEAARIKRQEKRLAKWDADHAEEIAKRKAEAEEAERKAAEEAERKAISQHIGNVGDRVQMTVTLEKAVSIEIPSFCGYGTSTMTIYTLVDENGNKLVWKTNSSLGKWVTDNDYKTVEEGEQITIKATIKNHGEYKGENQTEIQRVKLM